MLTYDLNGEQRCSQLITFVILHIAFLAWNSCIDIFLFVVQCEASNEKAINY